METNGSGRRYGVADEAIHAQMRDFGFASACYDALARSITALPVDSWNRGGGNTLYVRDLEECRERVRSAARFRLVNRAIRMERRGPIRLLVGRVPVTDDARRRVLSDPASTHVFG